MKFTLLLSFGLHLMIPSRSGAQEFAWAKDTVGHVYTSNESTVPGFKIKDLFSIINKIPAIEKPNGYTIKEWFKKPAGNNIYSTEFFINFYYYYRYQNGPIQYHNSHPPTISISINDPGALMNFQTILFQTETDALHLPVMFTDTFAVSYKTMNGCTVGQGMYTTFGRSLKIWVLNPKGMRFFRPVTKEEYLKVFIEDLKKKVEEDGKHLSESQQTLKELSKNEALKNSADEFAKLHTAMVKFVAFEKAKMEYYENKLVSMADDERRAPAYYAMYKKAPVLIDKDGNYLDSISGELLYAPLEDTKDTLATKALYTFNEQAFDPRLPKTAFQLMVIMDAFDQDDEHFLKEFLNKEFYPVFPFKELAALMCK